MVCMTLLGVLLAWVCRYAMGGYPLAILFCAQFAVGILFSMSAEKFALGLNGYLKGLLLFLVLYHLPVFRLGFGSGGEDLTVRPSY